MVNEFEKLTTIYQGRRVFVTGHTGFKGSWLVLMLHLLGADIRGYALPPERPDDLYNLMNGDSLCESIIDDIRDKQHIVNSIIDFKPHFIFHLAAQPLVRLSYEIPDATFDINIMGTSYLLEGVRKLENRCSVILITTDKVYKNNEQNVAYKETDRLGGYDPYSASKACTELLIESYRQSFFNINRFDTHEKSLAVARAGNVIGGGDWNTDRLFPDIVKSISKDKAIVIRNPNSVRPWQHVLDPLFGYLWLGKSLSERPFEFSSAYNFGPKPGNNMDVITVVESAINLFGKGSLEIVQSKENPYEAQLLQLNINKASSELGWIPKYNSEESIKLTVEWYKHFDVDPASIFDYTINQIKSYFSI